MKRIRCYDYDLEESDVLFKEIDKILCRSNYNVEIFEVSAFDKELPLNFEICDYFSRETIVLCIDGKIIEDREEIERIIHEEAMKDE